MRGRRGGELEGGRLEGGGWRVGREGRKDQSGRKGGGKELEGGR